ncbi:MAG: neutral/alkaline non-lysosomal ceramidase N-terminal domain-containing protein [Phycisphaerae bacterium]
MLCGVGRRVINPEPGHHLAGYGPDHPNAGVHDDIVVTAMYLSDGRKEAFLLTFDLIGLEAEFNLQVRQAVADATGLTAEQVFITATHVHSGPEVRKKHFNSGPTKIWRPDYNERLAVWSAQAAKDAKASAEECTLHYNYGYAAENMNRRYIFPDRRWLYIPDNKQLAGLSDQYVDRELGVVAFRRAGSRNQYKALVTNYTSHPLCVGNSSNLVSADFQGWIRRTIEDTFAGSMALTTTGAAGDNHPLMPESGFSRAMKMGTNLGDLAITRTYDSVLVDYDTRLRFAWKPITLKVKDRRSADLLPRRDQRGLSWWAQQGRTEIQTAVSLLGIGPILLVGMPGEPVAELGAILKWSSPFLKTYVLFQATDNLGYIATANQFLWGGYEVATTPLAQGEGERLVELAVQTAKELLDVDPLSLPAKE